MPGETQKARKNVSDERVRAINAEATITVPSTTMFYVVTHWRIQNKKTDRLCHCNDHKKHSLFSWGIILPMRTEGRCRGGGWGNIKNQKRPCRDKWSFWAVTVQTNHTWGLDLKWGLIDPMLDAIFTSLKQVSGGFFSNNSQPPPVNFSSCCW